MGRQVATAVMLAVALGVAPAALTARQAASPVIVLETIKGTIEIELFPADAPKSVAHILGLVRRNFYRGQRIHRVTAGLVQFGDPSTRDMSRRDSWGNGNSGTPIGVAEISKTRTQVRGIVGLAHSGTPAYADSQLYILKAASPNLNGKHAIVGRVVKGMDVVDKLAVADLIRKVSVKGEGGW